MKINEILAAMKADQIPVGWHGPWFIQRSIFTESVQGMRGGKLLTVDPGVYTFLKRLTNATLNDDLPGVTVMEDTPFELRTHLNFILQAKGSVLVTGLGLGCVIRGLLKKPEVSHITCLENSPDVLALVGPHMPKERLTIIEADARKWIKRNNENFDCAWHDLWTNPDKKEPHLDQWHVELLMNGQDHIKRQGAWNLNRTLRKTVINLGIDWIG